MLIWGVLLVLAGLGLIFRPDPGHAGSPSLSCPLNVFAQLGFLGNSNYPLWALTALALNVVVLYALTARWNKSQADIATAP